MAAAAHQSVAHLIARRQFELALSTLLNDLSALQQGEEAAVVASGCDDANEDDASNNGGATHVHDPQQKHVHHCRKCVVVPRYLCDRQLPFVATFCVSFPCLIFEISVQMI